MASVFGMPFALKSIIFNHRIDLLIKLAERPLIVQMTREPEQVIASMLAARERQFGDKKAWYSYKVPEYSQLRDLAPEEQVAGQIHSLETAIEKGLSEIPVKNKLSISYREFCEDPRSNFDRLVEKLEGLGGAVGAPKTLPDCFQIKSKAPTQNTLDAVKCIGVILYLSSFSCAQNGPAAIWSQDPKWAQDVADHQPNTF